MKTTVMRLLALITIMGICVAASAADTTVSEVWTCSINDGKTMDDVRAANSNWLKFMNANVEGGGISSNIVTSVVGNAERGHFMYVDSFPTLESWAEADSATEGNKEGEAIDAALQDAASCSENRLYKVEAS